MKFAEFHTPAELAALRQKTLINATGYGSRPYSTTNRSRRGTRQLARLIPQPEVNYGLFYKGVSFVPRRDGLVFQAVGEDDYSGFNDAIREPDPAEAAFAVNTDRNVVQTLVNRATAAESFRGSTGATVVQRRFARPAPWVRIIPA